MIRTVLWLFYDFLYLKNNVCPSKSNKQENLEKLINFSWRLEGH
jgi:hypothetical protein